MQKRLLLTLLVCSVSALHTADHRDLQNFKAAVLSYKTNKSAENLEKLLSIYETLTFDTRRPQWAEQARNFAAQQNIDIQKLAQAEMAPVAPAEPVRKAVPSVVAPAPLSAPARPVAPPPAPSPLLPKRPVVSAPAPTAPVIAQPAPVLTPARPAAPSAPEESFEIPVMLPEPSAPVMEEFEFEPEETVLFEECAPGVTEEEMQQKYEMAQPQEEAKPHISAPVILTAPEAAAPSLPPLPKRPKAARKARGRFKNNLSTIAEEGEEGVSSVSEVYPESLKKLLQEMRDMIKRSRKSGLIADLEVKVAALKDAFAKIASQLTTQDFENLQQDIGDLEVKLEQGKLHDLLDELHTLYTKINGQLKRGGQAIGEEVQKFKELFEKAYRSWVGPKTADKRRHAMLAGEYADLYNKLSPRGTGSTHEDEFMLLELANSTKEFNQALEELKPLMTQLHRLTPEQVAQSSLLHKLATLLTFVEKPENAALRAGMTREQRFTYNDARRFPQAIIKAQKKQAIVFEPATLENAKELEQLAKTVQKMRKELSQLSAADIQARIVKYTQQFNALKPHFKQDNALAKQVVANLRYMNDFARGGEKLAQENEQKARVLSGILDNLTRLDVKFSEQGQRQEKRSSQDEKQFIDLYEQAQNAFAQGIIPLNNAEKWRAELENGDLYIMYQILHGRGTPLFAPANFE